MYNVRVVFLIFLFIFPYFVFSSFVETDSQAKIYNFFYENMKITIGKNGNFPFYTLMTSVYITMLMFLLLLFLIIKTKEFKYNYYFQLSIYNVFLKNKISKNLFLNVFVTMFLAFFISLMGFYHFVLEDISVFSFRKDLVYFLYNNKIGIIVMEVFFSFLTLYFILHLYLLCIYFFNFLNGLVIDVDYLGNDKN